MFPSGFQLKYVEMANAVGERSKKRHRVTDRLLLLGTGLLVAIIGTAAFFLADEHHINPTWLFASFGGVSFVAFVGWVYRSRPKSADVASFLFAWMLVHVLILLLVLAYLGFIYYVPIVIVELWIGYTVAILLFGPPSDKPLH